MENIRFENLFKAFKPLIDELNDLKIEFFIAGGCIKDYFTSNNFKDIDIFFRYRQDLELVLEAFQQLGAQIILNNDKVIKIKRENQIYDLIKLPFNSATDIINSFDFTVTQFVITNKFDFYYTEEAFVDLSKKQLMLSNLLYPESTMIRVRKYMNNGYNICHEELNKIIYGIRNKTIEYIETKNELRSLDIKKEEILFHPFTIKNYTSKKYLPIISENIDDFSIMTIFQSLGRRHRKKDVEYDIKIIDISNEFLENLGFILPNTDSNNEEYNFYGID